MKLSISYFQWLAALTATNAYLRHMKTNKKEPFSNSNNTNSILGFENLKEVPMYYLNDGGKARNSTVHIKSSNFLDYLTRCHMMDEYIYYNDMTEHKSVIPLNPKLFEAGLFLQNSRDKQHCSADAKVDSNNCIELNFGREEKVVCELCRFFQPITEASVNQVLMDKFVDCRPEVQEIATKCHDGFDCIKTEPSVQSIETKISDIKFHKERELLKFDNALGDDKSRWMTSLHSKGLLVGIQLNDLILPGSHNSATIQMHGDKHCGGPLDLPTSLANKFALTQGVSIVDQLEKYGVRFLDLRVIENRNFYELEYPLHHTYLIDDKINTLGSVFKVVNDFLVLNPMETLVIRVKGRSKEGIACMEKNTDSNFHNKKWEKMIEKTQKLHMMNDTHLTFFMDELKGIALVDINEVIYEDWPGEDFGVAEKNDAKEALKYGEYYKEKIGIPNRYTVWDFFPILSGNNLDILMTSVAIWHEGLEDWSKPYSKHSWIMDSAVSLRANYVQAIMTDRVHETPIFEVASRLTLYRIFDRYAPSSWDLVSTQQKVNALDKNFEHHCPQKFVLQGLASYHDNLKEDRSWQFSCRRVEWLSSKSFYSWKLQTWKPGFYHPHSFNARSNDSGFTNDWDRPIDFYWEGGGVAITGIGGKHSNIREDRLYYFYASPVSASSSLCKWTTFINDWDGNMDYQLEKNEYIAGIYSFHHNWYEDRKWKLYICVVMEK